MAALREDCCSTYAFQRLHRVADARETLGTVLISLPLPRAVNSNRVQVSMSSTMWSMLCTILYVSVLNAAIGGAERDDRTGAKRHRRQEHSDGCASSSGPHMVARMAIPCIRGSVVAVPFCGRGLDRR